MIRDDLYIEDLAHDIEDLNKYTLQTEFNTGRVIEDEVFVFLIDLFIIDFFSQK